MSQDHNSGHFIELRQGSDQRSGTVMHSDLPGLPRGTEVILTPLSINEHRDFELTVHGETLRARYAGEAENNLMRFEVLSDSSATT